MLAVNILPDILLMAYIGLATFLTVKKREKSQTHGFDKYFFAVLVPYILLTSLASAAFATGKHTIPLLLTTATYVTVLTLSIIKVENRKKAYTVELLTGLTFLSVAITFAKPSLNINFLKEIVVLTLTSFAAVYIFHIVWKRRKEGLYLFPILSHFFDAASTVKALENGLNESQPLARAFIEAFGPNGIFVMKALVFIPMSYYISKEVEGEISRDLLYMIGIYGLILGLRNLFLLSSATTGVS